MNVVIMQHLVPLIFGLPIFKLYENTSIALGHYLININAKINTLNLSTDIIDIMGGNYLLKDSTIITLQLSMKSKLIKILM